LIDQLCSAPVAHNEGTTMPEDLKPIEDAARAAGYAFRADVTRIGMWATYVDGHPWNPRDDDGDALNSVVFRFSAIASRQKLTDNSGYFDVWVLVRGRLNLDLH